MNPDLLKAHARHDLQRLIPAAHYWLREHAPIADRELTTPLLQNPIGLSPREYVAAKALATLATYELESRAILEKAYPARDIGDETDCPGETFDEKRQIWGRLEVHRRDALVYAREIGNSQLIEAYQHPIAGPEHDSNTPLPESTAQRRVRWREWYGNGSRGAIQRVYERELLINPRADRSFIGKEIKKATLENKTAKTSGAIFSQLVQDGKRVK